MRCVECGTTIDGAPILGKILSREMGYVFCGSECRDLHERVYMNQLSVRQGNMREYCIKVGENRLRLAKG